MEKFKYIKKENFEKLPHSPGVYSFKRKKEILYIGKAGDLRKRVKNHFQNPSFRDSLFLSQIEKIGYVKTNSEIEALILEANLIKKIKPKFNILWKDDKNYFFVGITKEDFPRIFITHQIRDSKLETRDSKFETRSTKYIGPFVDGKALKKTLKLLRRVFPFRTCKKIPKRPCLWYQLKRCPAPCLFKKEKNSEIFENLKKKAKENTEKIKKIFEGKLPFLLKDLEKKMKKASQKLEFEKAKKMRDEILALKKILSHKIIFEEKTKEWIKIERELRKILKIKRKISQVEAYDISNIQGKEATGSMVVFFEGKEKKDLYRRFKIKTKEKPDDVGMLKEVILRRKKHKEWPFSDIILVDGGKAQLNAVLSCFENLKKRPKIIALAKRKNELFIEGEEKSILLKDIPQDLSNFLLRVRDEAHRFAISYHRKLRKKKIFGKIKK